MYHFLVNRFNVRGLFCFLNSKLPNNMIARVPFRVEKYYAA